MRAQGHSCYARLRVVRLSAQQRKEESLPGWTPAAPRWLRRNKDPLDLFQLLLIIALYDPSMIGTAVHVENA